MNIGEVLARSVMGRDFVEPEQSSGKAVPTKKTRAKKITHGFDPRKMVSTVSFTCTACGQHCGEDDTECPHCHAEFVDTVWNPPADIKEALEKQKATKVVADEEYPLSRYRCPSCNNALLMYLPHCAYCGQKLDWGDKK